MAKTVLISCVSSKLTHRAKAKDLYISPLFKYNLRYARTLNPENILILSAKYGLVPLEKEIDPYNQTLNTMKDKEIKSWAEQVIHELKKEVDLNTDEIIFLAGSRYRKYLIPHIKNYKIPLQGLGIGKQLQFLKGKVQHE
ncbi:hypothetical protein J4208_05075 [Candidatus Woesearchaeota archaeon]|nr:hypothetical protein [Candidatus Woesearchaeota archaeon]